MKVCKKCQVSFPVSNFYTSNKGYLNANCKPCAIQRTNKWRIINPERSKEAKREWNVENESTVKYHNNKNGKKYEQRGYSFLAEIKAQPCMDCGKIFPPEAMDFDHRQDQIKKINVSQMRRYSLEAIQKEIDKCDLVCSCCHRLRTFLRHRIGRSLGVTKQRLRNISNSAKDRPCEMCGVRLHPCQMDFDHIGEKSHGVCRMVGTSRSENSILLEISKCQVLCANCHRTETKRRKDATKT